MDSSGRDEIVRWMEEDMLRSGGEGQIEILGEEDIVYLGIELEFILLDYFIIMFKEVEAEYTLRRKELQTKLSEVKVDLDKLSDPVTNHILASVNLVFST